MLLHDDLKRWAPRLELFRFCQRRSPTDHFQLMLLTHCPTEAFKRELLGLLGVDFWRDGAWHESHAAGGGLRILPRGGSVTLLITRQDGGTGSVTGADCEHAARVESLLASHRQHVIDPPMGNADCISPKHHGHLFGPPRREYRHYRSPPSLRVVSGFEAELRGRGFVSVTSSFDTSIPYDVSGLWEDPARMEGCPRLLVELTQRDRALTGEVWCCGEFGHGGPRLEWEGELTGTVHEDGSADWVAPLNSWGTDVVRGRFKGSSFHGSYVPAEGAPSRETGDFVLVRG